MVHVNRIFSSQPCRYVIAMASLNRSCSLCRADITVKHAIRIKDDLASRISALLDVVVDLEDKLPQYICPKCKRRLVSLKNTAEDLVDFRELAKWCQSALKLQRGPLNALRKAAATLVSLQTLLKQGHLSKDPPQHAGVWILDSVSADLQIAVHQIA